ncbi:bifunctional phosphopantothenoylcysteine decarboxylase/phosphopantothenate--cysteine ligase CoaBC [Oceanibaculum indicum]|uniref:Coenzyme A biosynthesis bifunctional protein CoaBC n=1 Tax=Oceanibaculum indicum P24 TaxID=1207063 RepID=K2K208_9PROT|nr:bifunctional phosphopantothenoylcysteine decarboxylase/phosphopantothenate--cysteine ligase CoaBC [Oceanibaculum indicum]EKE71530.1 phosphopantothenoylcysteine decarboxylase/phosphopantothenate--cysteine ligase [Oceanibaculum indicum P24]
MLAGKRILLIVSGGIAAYKSLELVRRLRERGAAVRCAMTTSAEQFVTPLSLQALTEDKVYRDLFSLTDESEMGHINLSRQADLIVVAPATANILAKMAGGLADDLATTLLLATDKEVLAAPAMNVRMWTHAATQANLDILRQRGVRFVGPNEGDMACGEYGPGRMAEPLEIVAAIESYFGKGAPLAGLRALVTSGPTYEAIDPVRFIGNRSSGKQGHAIATALARAGAAVTLVCGPVALPDPAGVKVVRIESAREMLAACESALPADIAVFAAAVADWRVAQEAPQKIKKPAEGGAAPTLSFAENPDILASIAGLKQGRPALVIGFAAETEKVAEHAAAKRARKGCDWILANDVSAGTGTFGGDANTIHLVTENGTEDWPRLTKQQVAERLAARIGDHFGKKTT